MDSSELCGQCGGTFPQGERCRDRFDAGQALEAQDPACYAVHHLSVPSYMLQHDAYSARGWLEVRELLRRFVREGLTPDAARRENRTSMDSGRRDWSLTKGPHLPGISEVVWGLTMADVRLDTAEHYCADVHRWADAVVQDTDDLVRTSAYPTGQ